MSCSTNSLLSSNTPDQPYPLPSGLSIIPDHLLDVRPDDEIDQDLACFKPVEAGNEKNVWFFWITGYESMHGYTKRNVRTWYRRFVKRGWTIRVVDLVADSPLNLCKYLDVKDLANFPQAFIDGRLDGEFASQHASDLVRFPLLLHHGGVYADVALLQIGDLDRLWNEILANPSSPFEALAYGAEKDEPWTLMTYFLASRRNNPLFKQGHKIVLGLWAEGGGRTNAKGMHASPLLAGVPLVGEGFDLPQSMREDLSDYIFHGQALGMAMRLVGPADGWNGPDYVAQHLYAIDLKVGSSLYIEMTQRNGARQFELLSLRLPEIGGSESADQRQAREIVEATLQQSFSFKLAQGAIVVRVVGETLGSLWRGHEGSDNVPGTYAHWLRYAALFWNQDKIPPRVEYTTVEPLKVLA